MIPDVVWGTLSALVLGVTGFILGLRRDRTQAVLTQQQIDAGRIKDLMEEGRALDTRLEAANDKLQTVRSLQLECEAERNTALAEKAEALARETRCAQNYKECEEERQRITTLALEQQRELDMLRSRKGPRNMNDDDDSRAG